MSRFSAKQPVSTFSPSAKNAIATAKGFGASNSLSYPSDLPEADRFNIATYEVNYSRGGKESAMKSVLALPLPQKLTDSQGLMYTDTELGLIGGYLAQSGSDIINSVQAGYAGDQFTGAGGGMEGAGRSLASSVTRIVKNAVSTVSGMSGTDGLTTVLGGASQIPVVSKALKGIGGNLGAVTGTIGAITGQVANPNIIQYFKGVALKTYTLSWTLYPKSAGDAATIKGIIQQLRMAATPGTKAGDLILTYPYEFHMHAIAEGNQSLMIFKPAFCTAVTIDYTPSGMALMQDGQPAGTTISMNFKEIDIWTREDYGPAIQSSVQDIAATTT